MIKDELFQAIDLSSIVGEHSAKDVSKYLVEPGLNVLDLYAPIAMTDDDRKNIEEYSSSASVEIYRNFLGWLFETFNEEEIKFRKKLIDKLNLISRATVLITGCGFGDDIPVCLEKVGPEGEIHAQDLSREMVLHAASKNKYDNVLFSISNALKLPYQAKYFDAVFHFGGINLFGDIKQAIDEMARVCKPGGVVVFGDEGIAPNLAETEYGKIAINNNILWGCKAPMEYLPTGATNIHLEYILGNCFYIISFINGEGFPYMNIDLEHKGVRGGTVRTRYFGKVEGVTESAKKKLYDAARKQSISVHRYLTDLIEKNID